MNLACFESLIHHLVLFDTKTLPARINGLLIVYETTLRLKTCLDLFVFFHPPSCYVKAGPYILLSDFNVPNTKERTKRKKKEKKGERERKKRKKRRG